MTSRSSRDGGEESKLDDIGATNVTVTITLSDLQRLLTAQTSQLESFVSKELQSVRLTLERHIRTELEQQFRAAETSVKKFMKESIMDEDADADEASQALKQLKDHVTHMEQSLSQIQQQATTKSTSASTTSSGDSGSIANMDQLMENLEEVVDRRLASLERRLVDQMQQQAASATTAATPAPRDSTSSISTHGSGHSTLDPSTVQWLRRQQSDTDSLIATHMHRMEAFVDAQHAELVAYHSSAAGKWAEQMAQHYKGLMAAQLKRDDVMHCLDVKFEQWSHEMNDMDEQESLQEEEHHHDSTISASNKRGPILGKNKPNNNTAMTTNTTATSWVTATEKTLLRQQEDLRQSYQQLRLDMQQLMALQQQQGAGKTAMGGGSGNANVSTTTARVLLQGREHVLLSPGAGSGKNKNTKTGRPVSQVITTSTTSDDDDDDDVKSNASSANVHSDDDIDSHAEAAPAPKISTMADRLPILTPNMSSDQERNQRTKRHVLKFMDNLQTWKATKQQAGVAPTRPAAATKILTADDISLDGSSGQNVSDDDNDNDDDGVDHGKVAACLTTKKSVAPKSSSAKAYHMGATTTSNSTTRTDGPSTLLLPPKQLESTREIHFVKELVVHGLESLEAKLDKLEERNLLLRVDWNKQAAKLIKQQQATQDALTRMTNQRMDNVEQILKLLKTSGAAGLGSGSSDHANHGSLRSLNSKQGSKSVLSGNMTGFQQALDSLRDDLMQALEQVIKQGSARRDRGGRNQDEGDADDNDAFNAGGDVSEGVEGGRAPKASNAGASADHAVRLTNTFNTRLDNLEKNLKSALSILHQLSGKEIIITKLENAILERVDHLDASVQFKLDEIFQEIAKGLGGDELDQGPLVEAIGRHMEGMEIAITDQLKESIPDYGMAKALIAENLEEIKQIVSEVAISEVELLKAQLGVAEEAEQEALHAIVYLKDQLEETKRDETFGKIMGVTERYSKPQVTSASRKMSLGAQSALSYGSATQGMAAASNPRGLAISIPKAGKGLTGSGKRMDEWKRVFVGIEDKSADLRSAYNQLRAQREALTMQMNTGDDFKSSLKSSVKATEEAKEELMMSERDQSWDQLVYRQENDNGSSSGDSNYE